MPWKAVFLDPVNEEDEERHPKQAVLAVLSTGDRVVCLITRFSLHCDTPIIFRTAQSFFLPLPLSRIGSIHLNGP